jgi:hypothetical protein
VRDSPSLVLLRVWFGVRAVPTGLGEVALLFVLRVQLLEDKDCQVLASLTPI